MTLILLVVPLLGVYNLNTVGNMPRKW